MQKKSWIYSTSTQVIAERTEISYDTPSPNQPSLKINFINISQIASKPLSGLMAA